MMRKRSTTLSIDIIIYDILNYAFISYHEFQYLGVTVETKISVFSMLVILSNQVRQTILYYAR